MILPFVPVESFLDPVLAADVSTYFETITERFFIPILSLGVVKN